MRRCGPDEGIDSAAVHTQALHPLELTAEQRRLARVPPLARHMAFLHPLAQRDPVTAHREAGAATGHLLAADELLEACASDGFALCDGG